jgi:hypothetical protein
VYHRLIYICAHTSQVNVGALKLSTPAVESLIALTDTRYKPETNKLRLVSARCVLPKHKRTCTASRYALGLARVYVF